MNFSFINDLIDNYWLEYGIELSRGWNLPNNFFLM
jgi:hypothetical protein